MSNKDPYKLFYMGSPEFALPALEALINDSRFEVCCVITQPDMPAGRGNKLTPPPVKLLAEKHSVPVFQPRSLRSFNPSLIEPDCDEAFKFLHQHKPFDIGIVVAYGKIIPASILNFPKRGIVNIHPSLLPRWRGAAPIQHALFSGDKETGICLMKLDEGLDTGPVYAVEHFGISESDNFGSLSERLSKEGALMLIKHLEEICSGACLPTQQNDSGVTYANKWESEDYLINWSESADVTLRRIRTCSPHKGAKTSLDNKTFKIYAAHKENIEKCDFLPGTVVHISKSSVIVSTGSGAIGLDEVQLEGKKQMQIKDAVNGGFLKLGTVFK